MTNKKTYTIDWTSVATNLIGSMPVASSYVQERICHIMADYPDVLELVAAELGIGLRTFLQEVPQTKSDVIKQVAADLDIPVQEVKPAECDPVDFKGVPKIIGKDVPKDVVFRFKEKDIEFVKRLCHAQDIAYLIEPGKPAYKELPKGDDGLITLRFNKQNGDVVMSYCADMDIIYQIL